ncbi:SpaA isopeptide-forming pilin-related protein [Marinilactibacillus sp. GCM10026970]|uniref:SpaA isopeptide-forming pilin-related protein n=1 Tax=Marinilactibacillus sp. GCM10026970 TaxID=3252642 RepID=UPI003615791C
MKKKIHISMLMVLLLQTLWPSMTAIAEMIESKALVSIIDVTQEGSDDSSVLSFDESEQELQLELEIESKAAQETKEVVISVSENFELAMMQEQVIISEAEEIGTYRVEGQNVYLSFNDKEYSGTTSITVKGLYITTPGKTTDILGVSLLGKNFEKTIQYTLNESVTEISEQNAEESDNEATESIQEVEVVTIEEETTEATTTEEESVISEEFNELEESQMMSAMNIQATDSQMMLRNVRFTDSQDKVFGADYPYDLNAKPVGRLSFDWLLSEGHTVSGGDVFSFNLPAQFRPVSGTNGTLGDVGTWAVNNAGVVTFTFNDNIDGDDASGDFWFEIILDESALSDAIEQEIIFEDLPEFTINFPVIPKGGSLVDKSGTINKEGFNSSEASWTVDINTTLATLINASVTDELPRNMIYKEESLEIVRLQMTSSGNKTEVEVLDPSKYSLNIDEEGNPLITFDGLNETESQQAYRIKYVTEIVEPSEGFDGNQTFTNNAVLSNNNQNHNARATVSSGYGKAIEKLDPKYDATSQTFEWTINYNYNEKYIDADKATIQDNWSPVGSMGLSEDNLSVYPVMIDENGAATVSETPIDNNNYKLEIQSDFSGFNLEFLEDIDQQAYQIRYTTNLRGSKGTGIVDNSGAISNNIETGTEKNDGSRGTWTQQGLIKRRTNTNIDQKTISWNIAINGNSYRMDNLVLTDTFTGDGLTLIKNETNHSKFELRIMNGEEEFTDYTLVYNEPDQSEGRAGGFVIEFTQPINQPLNLQYTTHFERNSDGSGVYRNHASIDWELADRKYTIESGQVDGGNTRYTASNGVKSGSYNAVTQEITWAVNTNYARLPIQENYKISDKIPANQEMVEESLTVYEYRINESGAIISKTDLNVENYTMTFPNQDNDETLDVSLSDSMIGEHTAIGVEFKTRFKNNLAQDSRVENTAVVTNGETFTLPALVSIPNGGLYGKKFGNQAGESNERIDWTIEMNPNQSTISQFKLTDNPDLNSILLEETFRVYEASVNASGELSKTEVILEEGKEYNLTIDTDSETGYQEFILSFNDEINKAYILEYSSFIDPLVGRGENITNQFKIEGLNVSFATNTEEEINIVKSNAGGGSGSAVRGSFVIQKENESGEQLAGAVFNLYTSNGQQLLRTGETNADGELEFGNLRRGNYLLREVQVPEGYVISDELAEGIRVQLAHTDDNPMMNVTYVNALTKVTINKVDDRGQRINDNVIYRIFDSEQTLVRDNVVAEDGTITVEDLAPDNYFIEEAEAPEGYILNTRRSEFVIRLEDNGTQEIPTVEFRNYQGSAQLKKTDAARGNVSGGTFEVIDAETKEVVASDLTSVEGVVTATGLAPGTYQFREVTAPTGYIRNTDSSAPFTIAETADGAPSVVEVEEPFVNYQGSIQFVKTDGATGLENAIFEIMDANQNVIQGNLVSNSEGVVTATGLAPGAYTLRETEAPEGYILDTKTIDFDIPEKYAGAIGIKSLGDIRNYQGEVLLTKTDSTGTIDLENAVFELYTGDNVLIGAFTSNDQGQIRVKNLVPGEYKFVEKTAPEGYIRNTESIDFTINPISDGVPELKTLIAVNYQGSIEFNKVSGSNEETQTLSGAEFRVVNAELNPDDENYVVQEVIISQEDGKVEVTDLAPGRYYFEETQAPAGYLINTERVEFIIDETAEGEPEVQSLSDFNNYQRTVQLTKRSVEEVPITTGAVFNLEDSEGNLLQSDLRTNDEGIIIVENLAPGAYRFVEKAAPEGYILNTEPITFNIKEEAKGEPSVLNVEAINYQGVVELEKVDASGNKLAGAVFNLETEDQSVIREDLITEPDGKLTVSNLAPGTYYFRETTAPTGYLINEDLIKVIVGAEADKTPALIKVEAVNYQGSAQLIKTSNSGTTLSGAVFEVINSNGELQEGNLISNDDGLVEVDDLAPGDYQFIETSAREGYIRNTKPIDFKILNSAGGAPEMVVADNNFINYQGNIQFVKIGNDNVGLPGAVFQILNDQEDVVQTVTSDSEGVVRATGLIPGSYSLQEIEAPNGYLVNSRAITFVVESEYEGDPGIQSLGDFQNYQGSVRLTKRAADSTLLQNAEFRLETTSGFVLYTDLRTNENGELQVDGLAPGSYRFVEINAPAGYVLNTNPITFDIDSSALSEPSTVEVEAINYLGSVELTKISADDTLLENAEFVLESEENGVIQENLSTDSEGKIRVDGLVPDNYFFRETKAPEGYVVNNELVKFTIDPESKGIPVLQEVEAINYQGSVRLVKTDQTGRVLSGAVFDLVDSEDQVIENNLESTTTGEILVDGLAPGEYHFIETQAPEGYIINTSPVGFTIVDSALGEPVEVTADAGFMNYQGSIQFIKVDNNIGISGAIFQIVNDRDEVILSTLISDANGVVRADELAPGTYYLEETAAPVGYVRNTERIQFTIAAENAGDPGVQALGDFHNYKGSVTLTKQSANQTVLEGAEFRLETIDGQALQSGLVTGANGELTVANLAPGSYRFIETKAPAGHVLNTEPIEFTIDPTAYAIPLNKSVNAVNYQGSVELTKVSKNDEPLEQAVFSLMNQDSKMIHETLTTNSEGKIRVDGLAPGTYTFKEIKAPVGYILNEEEVTFTIDALAEGTPNVQSVEAINYKGQARLVKTDAAGEILSEATFDLLDQAGNVIRESLISDVNGLITVSDLAPGDYRFIETKAPDGYILNTMPVDFTIEASSLKEPVEVIADASFENYQGSIQFAKVDQETGIPGAIFQIVDESDLVVQTDLISDENGIVRAEGLAPGTYYLKETKAPNGYVLNTEQIAFTVEADHAGNPGVMTLGDFPNYQGTARLTKYSSEETVLEGAEFRLETVAGFVLETGLITDKNGVLSVNTLAPGAYQFVETKAPTGYVLNTEPVEFEIESVAKSEPVIVEVAAINYQGTVQLSKVTETGEALPGATFALFDADSLDVEQEVVSDEQGIVRFAQLAPGNYIIRETQPVIGYIRNTREVEVIIEDSSSGQPVVTDLGEFTNYQGAVLLTKRDSADATITLAETAFTLFDQSGTELMADIVTNADGQVEVDGLAPGEYHFIETQAPPGYDISYIPIEFEIEPETVDKPEMVLATATNSKLIITEPTEDSELIIKTPKPVLNQESNRGLNSNVITKLTTDPEVIKPVKTNQSQSKLPQTGFQQYGGIALLGGVLTLMGTGIFLSNRKKVK